ncbi:hypothetical protein HPB48_006113 [Haemaphysalis longicornis]|uniref:Uncharacterized protein n=1 Tax=Haemaphysalis longicornis TaxID=44386 RepID=A0A9J6GZM6_HAELO|nr:hypothetical protein HPB48_006113 [Haemaphysalis longicornis]
MVATFDGKSVSVPDSEVTALRIFTDMKLLSYVLSHGHPAVSYFIYSILYYLNIVDTVLTFIVPFALIAAMNFMIGRSIYLFYARYRLQRRASGHNSDYKKSSGEELLA